MRRWPMYIVFAVCILLTLSLFNSWSMETELRNRLAQLSTQLQECSKQQTTCMEDSLTLLEQKEGCVSKINDLDKQKIKLKNELKEYKNRASNAEAQVNSTSLDVQLCKTEMHTLKKETLTSLTTKLMEKKQRIEDLEKEVEKLKQALTTKSAPNPSVMSKVTPDVLPVKISPPLNANNLNNEPVIEDNAKEEMEDNAINDDNAFDPQL